LKHDARRGTEDSPGASGRHPSSVTRSEHKRGLAGITDEEARRRFLPMNSISWIIAQLARQGQCYWLTRAQGQVLIPELNTDFAAEAPDRVDDRG
jgi:hypothetical protein